MISNTGFILNLITFCINSSTCFISFIILIIILHHFCHTRIRRRDKITVIHCINIYPLLLIYTGTILSFNIQTLLGDLYGLDFSSPWCIFMGYFSPVILSTLYCAFANQAFYRLCRIVYSTYKWLQYIWLYIIIPPIELVLICILMSPLLFWHDIVYFRKQYYCYIPFANLRSILYAFFIAYGNPLILLLLMYLRITIFLHRQANDQTRAIKRRQERDLLVIRRILITVSIFTVIGIPAIVFIIMSYIAGEEHPLLFRIEWLFVSLTMIGLSLSQVIFMPQLKSIILRKLHYDRAVPLDHNVSSSILTDITQQSYE